MLILGLDVGSRWMKGTLVQRGLLRKVCTHGFRRPISALPLSDQVMAALTDEAPGVDLVVLSLSRDLVVNRNLTLPFKDLRKVAAVMPGEAERNLPFPLREAVVRHLICDETAPAQTHAMLMVMNKRDLEPVSALLAGLHVHEATAAVDSLGTVNAWLDEAPPGEATVLLDVGAKKTCVEVVNGGRLVFSRSLSVAGDAFTAAIATRLRITPPEAEALKCALGTPEEPAGADAAKAALVEAYQKLMRELKRTVLSARNLWPAMQLTGVKLCGGSARAPGLAEAVTEAVGLPAALFAPRLLAGRSLAGDPSMAASAGLALTGIRRAKLELDFLGRPRDIVRFHRKEIGVVLVLVLVMLLVSWAAARRDLALLRAESEEDDQAIAAGLTHIGELTRQAVSAGGLDKVAARLHKLQTVLSEDTASRMALLNDVSRSLPDGLDVTFRSLVLERNTVELEAETDSFDSVQKVEESLKKGLGRPIEVQQPHNETREDRTISVVRLKFAVDPGAEVKK